jgi:FdhE protein
VPFLRLPDAAQVFAERALRLRQLAAGHPMREFLLFAAQLAEAQQRVLAAYPAVPLPDAETLDACARRSEPPLPAARWPRDAAWRAGLAALCGQLQASLPDGPAQQTAARLQASEPEWLEAQADRILANVSIGIDIAAAPFIAAALQVYWTHLVAATDRTMAGSKQPPFGRTVDASCCPCCGSRPVASIVRIGGDTSGYRYLQCALCSTQWHMVRIKCTHCENTKGIQYWSLEGADPAAARDLKAVQAETCDECGHYLKIVSMQKDPQVEPVADDLATLALDLLVTEGGKQPHGINLMLFYAESPPGDPPPDALRP